MNEPVLAVSQLTVERTAVRSEGESPGIRDGRPLLGPLDFEIARGERVGLVGPSGSGKSVTIKCVLGLLGPGLHSRGTLRSNGESFELGRGRAALAPLRGRRFAWLPQHAVASFSPVDRVGWQLAQLQAIHGGEASPASLLERVGLERSDMDRYPHELSGGMAQRVNLAMALACRPSLLLADEPCSALDGPARAAFLATLQRCSTEASMALLFVSHELADTRRLCPRMLVIDDGRIVERGSTAELVDAPRHPTTQAIVDAARRTGVRHMGDSSEAQT